MAAFDPTLMLQMAMLGLFVVLVGFLSASAFARRPGALPQPRVLLPPTRLARSRHTRCRR